jgi:hypothetical protein
MTKERLRALSLESLQELARKEGVELSTHNGREALIDSILEAMEEDRSERETDNNLAILMEGRKYDITPEEELESQESEEYAIPEQYNETRIVLLLRDPWWAFTYWDVNETEAQDLRDTTGFEELALRVNELAGDVFNGENSLNYYDIPVQFSDTCWYVNLAKQEKSYCVELIARLAGKVKTLARSNTVYAPRGDIAMGDDGQADAADAINDEMILLSGLHSAGISSYGSVNPQRIISILDAQYVRLKG